MPPLKPRAPDAHRPEVIADAIVACAVGPRSEITVGGESRAVELAWSFLRPAGEAMLGLAHRLYRTGARPDRPPGHLWKSTGDGEVRDGCMAARACWAPCACAAPSDGRRSEK